MQLMECEFQLEQVLLIISIDARLSIHNYSADSILFVGFMVVGKPQVRPEPERNLKSKDFVDEILMNMRPSKIIKGPT